MLKRKEMIDHFEVMFTIGVFQTRYAHCRVKCQTHNDTADRNGLVHLTMEPACGNKSHKTANQPSHFLAIDRDEWQAEKASTDFWLPCRDGQMPFSFFLFCLYFQIPVTFFLLNFNQIPVNGVKLTAAGAGQMSKQALVSRYPTGRASLFQLSS